LGYPPHSRDLTLSPPLRSLYTPVQKLCCAFLDRSAFYCASSSPPNVFSPLVPNNQLPLLQAPEPPQDPEVCPDPRGGWLILHVSLFGLTITFLVSCRSFPSPPSLNFFYLSFFFSSDFFLLPILGGPSVGTLLSDFGKLALYALSSPFFSVHFLSRPSPFFCKLSQGRNRLL